MFDCYHHKTIKGDNANGTNAPKNHIAEGKNNRRFSIEENRSSEKNSIQMSRYSGIPSIDGASNSIASATQVISIWNQCTRMNWAFWKRKKGYGGSELMKFRYFAEWKIFSIDRINSKRFWIRAVHIFRFVVVPKKSEATKKNANGITSRVK